MTLTAAEAHVEGSINPTVSAGETNSQNDTDLPTKVLKDCVPSQSPVASPTEQLQDTLADEGTENESRSSKQHRASISGKRLSGRPAINHSYSSLQSLASQMSLNDLNTNDKGQEDLNKDEHGQPKTDHAHQHRYEKLVSQVSEWLQQEKAKRKTKHKDSTLASTSAEAAPEAGESASRPRSISELSDESSSLAKLEQILAINAAPSEKEVKAGRGEKKGLKHSRSWLLKPTSGAASSDTDYLDGEAFVNNCDVVLDNSKTLSYTGGGAEGEDEVPGEQKNAAGDRDAWNIFKNEILRLAHTLKLNGWRHVPLNAGSELEVERMSGALTNAIYVVSPPKNLPRREKKGDPHLALLPRKPPPKLLLRIYGPQVEHLIDRESELQILRRLARKRIGPRLLGTFLNGRFEEYLYAKALKPEDLRRTETSKQIAKRMRELHEGIDLLEQERDAGPFVWQNWDKWVDRCERVVTFVDEKILASKNPADASMPGSKHQGLICGVEWAVFRRTVDKYRLWLESKYGGQAGVRKQLVFSHNDTQYGNILRMQPSGESPLLLPANEHKQLVVIDFEYASANLPGLEFGNHFTEWCYNYHDPKRSYALNLPRYPTPDKQRAFIQAYVYHRPPISGRPSMKQSLGAAAGSSSSIPGFMLDSRAPPSQVAEEEVRRDKATEAEVTRLMHDARLWRVANSAQWVAWGIVQATVPGLEDAKQESNVTSDDPTEVPKTTSVPDETVGAVAEEEEEEEEEFDYLAYAQQRAMFFWGDVVTLGVIAKDELPVALQERLMILEY